MKYLLVILVFISLLEANVYRQTSKEVVIDNKNKLMWVDNPSVYKLQKTHEEASDYCQNLVFGGYSNWRLPNIEEFETIVNKKNFKNYIISAFKYNVPDGYWASKAHWRTLWFYADYMHFISGTPYYDSRHKKKYVRCVRKLK